MPIRFRKSIKIAPGVKVNVGKKSTSVSIGGKGIHHTISSTGRSTITVGVPGTGLYYSESTSQDIKSERSKHPKTQKDMTAEVKTERTDDITKKSGKLKALMVVGVIFLIVGALLTVSTSMFYLTFVFAGAFMIGISKGKKNSK